MSFQLWQNTQAEIWSNCRRPLWTQASGSALHDLYNATSKAPSRSFPLKQQYSARIRCCPWHLQASPAGRRQPVLISIKGSIFTAASQQEPRQHLPQKCTPLQPCHGPTLPDFAAAGNLSMCCTACTAFTCAHIAQDHELWRQTLRYATLCCILYDEAPMQPNNPCPPETAW